MPIYGSREKESFGDEFLRVVFSKMGILMWIGGVESEDVSCRFEFRDSDEPNGFVGA